MSSDATGLPARSAPDGFAIQATNARRIAGRTEGGCCRVKDRDVLRVISSGADAEWRGSVEGWVLFIEEEAADEGVEVCLTDIFPECLERAAGVLESYVKK